MPRNPERGVVLLDDAPREQKVQVLVELCGIETPPICQDTGLRVDCLAGQETLKKAELGEEPKDMTQEPQVSRGRDGS